jgi:hypothetical protein
MNKLATTYYVLKNSYYIYLAVTLSLFPITVFAGQDSVKIGDPKELFLSEKPQEVRVEKKEKPPEAKNLSEFFGLMKKDLKQTFKDIGNMGKEITKPKRHSYRDPDFTPPERPDWR